MKAPGPRSGAAPASGTLSAGVAHEINNPLAVILGFTEILLDRIPLDSKEYEILKSIERQGFNCKRIVENLMGFARTPSQQEAFSDLNHNVQTVLLLVQNTLLTKKIDLKLHLAPDLPQVKGGAGELQQVFLNLITNAVAAMPEGGRLTVESRFDPDKNVVKVMVADTGTGIPKEFVDRIFDPFFTTKKGAPNAHGTTFLFHYSQSRRWRKPRAFKVLKIKGHQAGVLLKVSIIPCFFPTPKPA